MQPVFVPIHSALNPFSGRTLSCNLTAVMTSVSDDSDCSDDILTMNQCCFLSTFQCLTLHNSIMGVYCVVKVLKLSLA